MGFTSIQIVSIIKPDRNDLETKNCFSTKNSLHKCRLFFTIFHPPLYNSYLYHTYIYIGNLYFLPCMRSLSKIFKNTSLCSKIIFSSSLCFGNAKIHSAFVKSK